MPVAKLLGSNTSDEMKSEEGNDSLDTLIRAVGKQEPLFPFSRTADSPTQWIQLLHPFEQQGINKLSCLPNVIYIQVWRYYNRCREIIIIHILLKCCYELTRLPSFMCRFPWVAFVGSYEGSNAEM